MEASYGASMFIFVCINQHGKGRCKMMNEDLRKTSNIFWIIFAVTLVLSYTACGYIYCTVEQLDQMSFSTWIMIIPNLILTPLWESSLYGPVHIALSYALLMIPAVFAAIAVVLRKIAKAWEECVDS